MNLDTRKDTITNKSNYVSDSLTDTEQQDGLTYHILQYKVNVTNNIVSNGVISKTTSEKTITEKWIIYNEGTDDEYIKPMEV